MENAAGAKTSAAESAKENRRETLKTNEFIAELRRAPENQLVFVDGNGHAVHTGYHLTELKAASLDTVDCGGQANQWQETIVQLWVPANLDNNYMSAGKFLKISNKVRGIIPLNFDAAIRIEYGDENFFPSTYDVRSITHTEDVTRVLLRAPETTCKARDRRHKSIRSEAERETCCSARSHCSLNAVRPAVRFPWATSPNSSRNKFSSGIENAAAPFREPRL
jgi:hypothetical protein